jgi:acyl-coenzyme A synthetase/AMP-(fatty) acid ligase
MHVPLDRDVKTPWERRWTAGRLRSLGKTGGRSPSAIRHTLFEGRSIIPYYWKDPERTREYLVDGWLKTDDIVYQDSEGYFHFVSRSDDLIISSGWTISPREIEEVMIEHPAISEAAVIGIADHVKGNIPVGVVVLNPHYKPNEGLGEEVKSFVKTKLAPFKYPRKIRFVQAIPKTATGKVDRKRIKEIWAGEE